MNADDMEKIKEIGFSWAKYTMNAIERTLVGEIEKTEGRMVSNEEVEMHCHCGIYADGSQEYKWKGVTIMRASFDQKEGALKITTFNTKLGDGFTMS